MDAFGNPPMAVEVAEPPSKPVPPLPQHFVAGCFGNFAQAQRRWEDTCRWREQQKVERLFRSPQPYFHAIKAAYPHFFGGVAVDGSLVHYERCGQMDVPGLQAAGVDMQTLLRHYIFLMESTWRVVAPTDAAPSPEGTKGDDADEKPLVELDDAYQGFRRIVSVFDLQGLRITARDLLGPRGTLRFTLDFIRRAASIAQNHYPERCAALLFINAPPNFERVWRFVSPMLNEVTRRKLRIFAPGQETFNGLARHISYELIPQEYGGLLGQGYMPGQARWTAKQERYLWRYATQLRDLPEDADADKQAPNAAQGYSMGYRPNAPAGQPQAAWPGAARAPPAQQPFLGGQPQPQPQLQQQQQPRPAAFSTAAAAAVRPFPSAGGPNAAAGLRAAAERRAAAAVPTAAAVRRRAPWTAAAAAGAVRTRAAAWRRDGGAGVCGSSGRTG